MDQAQYWMWTNKQKQYNLAATGGCDSWEEQAFAEDAAAGALGGCIWPPRSYSCTFCEREFRSAQALGGHMNVHRRDRARLKQSQNPQTGTFLHENTTKNSILLHPDTILDAQSQGQTCSFIFNPNIDLDHRVDSTTLSSPIRVSSAPRLSSKSETKYLFPYVEEQRTTISPPKSSFNSEKQSHFLRNSVKEKESPSRGKGDNIVKANLSIPENPREALELATTSRPNNKRGTVKADLSISLNLVICRNNNTSRDSDDDGDGRCKKRRFDPAFALNLFSEQASHDVSRNGQLRTMNSIVSSIDDVDLELRLGDAPKVR